MAQGQTTRNNLSMRNPDDVGSSLREIKRWADRLPLAAAGFHARTLGEGIGAGVGASLTFSIADLDKERWKSKAGNQTTFTVPPGLSGVYVLNAAVWWNANVADIHLMILVNNVAVGVNHHATTATDRATCSATVSLQDGDVLALRVLNASAGVITITNYAGDVNKPVFSFFNAWRISLL